MHQQTLRRPLSSRGIGLHTGERSRVTIFPAPPHSGIQFVRRDIARSPTIPARIEYVAGSDRGTTLGRGSARVHTVEHLLSALWGMGVDNARIEIEGREVPNMDGSALPWVRWIRKVGVVNQPAMRKFHQVSRRVVLEDGGSEISILPAKHFRVLYFGSFPTSHFQSLPVFFESRNGEYLHQIAGARTFGFIWEVERLRRKGLARGASSRNALVLGKNGYLNAPRFADEPARHKVLDLLGDLALLGQHIQGCVVAIKSGHKLHHRLVERLSQDGG